MGFATFDFLSTIISLAVCAGVAFVYIMMANEMLSTLDYRAQSKDWEGFSESLAFRFRAAVYIVAIILLFTVPKGVYEYVGDFLMWVML